MISRAHRFHGPNSLNYVYRNGATVRGPLFAVKSIVNNRRDQYRVAVVVSRKVHKSAVVRNRIRRRLYGAVKTLDVRISDPYDIVITVFGASVMEESTKNILSQVERQLASAGVFGQ
jgi:ribonuclease P protein component